METAKITITLNMSKADYDRIKAEKGGMFSLRRELEKAIIEKLGVEIVVKSLKAEYGDIK